MKKKLNIIKNSIISFVLLLPFIITAPIALDGSAESNKKILDNLGGAAKEPFGATSEVSSVTPGQLVGNIVKSVLAFTGTVAFIIFLYGGFMWLTARGNEDQVGKAKKFLTNGVIGTVIVIVAYALTYYITDVVFQATRG